MQGFWTISDVIMQGCWTIPDVSMQGCWTILDVITDAETVPEVIMQ